MQAWDADLDAIAGLVYAADKFPYFTALHTAALATLTAFARSLLDDANGAAARVTLGARYGLLGSLTAVSVNALGDTLIPISSARYVVDRILLENASVNLNTARAGVFSAAGGIGPIAADQVLTACSAPDKYLAMALSGLQPTDIFTGANLYFRVGTIQGSAATVNVWIMGYDLS